MALTRRGCLFYLVGRAAHLGTALSSGPRARLRGTAPAGLLYSWRATGPGATRLHLVLDAADSISDAGRLCGLCTQCARQHRLWTELYQVGRPRLLGQRPAGTCACHDPRTAPGQDGAW